MINSFDLQMNFLFVLISGALEDILLGLKNEPYRRADAVRRSQRRRIDNRLSRTIEELDV